MKKINALFLIVFFTSCIGTNEIEDEIVSEEIMISSQVSNLMVDETIQFESSYYNEYGIEAESSLDWTSSNVTVATISNDGILTALNGGQTNIYASIIGVEGDSIKSEKVLITVIEDLSDLTSVIIEYSQSNVEKDATLQLSYTALDGAGEEYVGSSITWMSSDESIATVSETGLVSGIDLGFASITLNIDGIQSSPLVITVGSLVRSGAFVVVDYEAAGSAVFSFDTDNNLILDLSDDFSTVFLAGTWIFLSNSIQGSTIKAQGLPVANISTSLSGAQSFNITDLQSDVELDEYQYVVILCEPFGLTMAYAEMK